MQTYNLCFCLHDTCFYIFNHQYISSWANHVTINAYPVESHAIFNFCINILSIAPVTINTTNVTKICPIKFEIDPSNHDSTIEFDFLQNNDLLANIGHSLIDCINKQNNIIAQLMYQRNQVELALNKCMNKIDQLNENIQVAYI